MIRFGYLYVNGKLTIFDVSKDESFGYTCYVAALSEDPAIAFRSVRPETAIEKLCDYLEHGTGAPTLSRVTWQPEQVERKPAVKVNTAYLPPPYLPPRRHPASARL